MTIVSQGTLNLAALVVPDLYVVIVPPQTALLNGVPTNILGIVGTASWGPVNQPILISDMPSCLTAFGPPINRKYDLGTHVAIAVLQGAQNMRAVRVTDGTDTAASVAQPPGCMSYTAKYSGSAGNNLTVTLAAGSKAGTFKALVAVAGGLPEIYDNIAGTGNAFWVALASAINNGNGPLRGASQLIVASAGAGTTAPAASVVALSGGSDGSTPGVSQVNSATLVGANGDPSTGMYSLAGLGCSILDVCDADDSTQWSTIDQFALGQGMYAIQTGPSGDTISNAVSSKYTAGIDSYSTKMLFGNWVLWNDQFNAIQRYVSPQGFAAGRLANLSPQYTTLNKTLYGVIGTQLTLQQNGAYTTFSSAQLQSLIQAGIDTITNPGAGGVVGWTFRSGHNSSSNAAVHGDNYTRMTNYAAATLNAGMGVFLGLPITLSLVQGVTATLNAFLLGMLGVGMLGTDPDDNGTPFSVACALGPGTNNPPNMAKLGYLTANVQIQYLSINEFFIVNLEGGQTVTVTRAVAPVAA